MLPYRVPKFFIYAALILAVLAMIPPVLIARKRAVNTNLPRIQLQQDMGRQFRFRAQQPSLIFADGRAMRPPVEGTIAQGELRDDDHYYKGLIGTEWAEAFPDAITVDMELVQRGRERYDIFCAVCHGQAGFGDGMVHQRAQQLADAGRGGTIWVPPTSLHDLNVVDQPVGQIYNTISNGLGNMAAYGPQIPVHDRWAIVAYVRALQRSQNAPPPDGRVVSPPPIGSEHSHYSDQSSQHTESES